MDNTNLWEVSWFEDKDKAGVLLLNKTEYGDAVPSQECYFDWIQKQNPMGHPIFPIAHEVSSGRIIASVMFAPARLVWKGKPMQIMIGFNLMVEKEFRRKGLSSEIIKVGCEEGKRRGYQFMTALANPKSAAVQKKLGSLILPDIPMVIRPLQIADLMQQRTSNPLLLWGAKAGWAIAGATIYREQRPSDAARTVILAEEDCFSERFNAFWEKVKNKYDLMIVRDEKFLNWRFIDCQDRNYQILTANRNGDLLGYLVLRYVEVRGIPCGLISDFLVLPGKEGDTAGLCLLNEATQRFREAGVSMGGGLMLPLTQEYQLMRRGGYIPCPPSLAPQSLTPIVHQLVGEIPDDAILNPRTWFITIADHDAV